jgi:predicted DNA-binding transcriptional regulator AlpA
MKATGSLSKPFFTIKEAASYLGISDKTFRRYLKRAPEKGGPPRRRITSQCVRIPVEQFVSWIETKSGK